MGWITAVVALLLTGCVAAASDPAFPQVTTPEPAEAAPPAVAPATRSAADAVVPVVPTAVVREIRYRAEVRTPDPSVADFGAWLASVFADGRGWTQAGFVFVEDPAAAYAIVLAEGPEIDLLCLPYIVSGRYSCQNGPLVALNADRWREATPEWLAAGGDLTGYRQMLVNHEVGHLLGMHHIRCRPVAGEPPAPAPVMEQQSTELDGCLPNPWPTPVEITLAASGEFLLAPPPREVPFPP